MVKIRGRIFSRKGGNDENQSTKDNSDSGGCETLETPNIFLFTSVLSFITILIRSCFYFRKIYSPSQSISYFI